MTSLYNERLLENVGTISRNLRRIADRLDKLIERGVENGQDREDLAAEVTQSLVNLLPSSRLDLLVKYGGHDPREIKE